MPFTKSITAVNDPEQLEEIEERRLSLIGLGLEKEEDE